MRNLDETNPVFLRPSKFAGFSAFTLGVLTLLSIPLAYGAAPNVRLVDNPIVLMVSAIFFISVVLALVSAIFRWGWKAYYYGVSLLCLGSISFLALVPLLAMLLYGGPPHSVKIIIVIFYGVSHFIWCRRFVRLYRRIFGDKVLRPLIYDEEAEATYYMRKGDDFILDKHYKFSQIPQNRYFVLFIAVALLMMPVMDTICAFMGMPFVHIFLLIAMLPVSWMSIGLAVRAYLIFYLYPFRIRRATGKEVYVDLVSKYRSAEQVFR